MKYTHIVFDIDGTMINSGYACLRSLQDTLEALTGSAPSREELAFTLGIPGIDALKQLGISDTSAAFQIWDRNLLKYWDTVTLFPGIPELLEELKRRGCELGIVTSQTRKEYAKDFAPLPVARHFTTLVRADDAPEHKPSPAPLFKFMELAGCGPAETLFVGDQEGDLCCARGAGVDFALAGWSHPNVPSGWTYRLEKPADLLQYL